MHYDEVIIIYSPLEKHLEYYMYKEKELRRERRGKKRREGRGKERKRENVKFKSNSIFKLT